MTHAAKDIARMPGPAGYQSAAREKTERSGIARFHDGEPGVCPRCGRHVFLPCLACRIEQGPLIQASKRTKQEESEELHIELRGKERQRYLRVRRQRERAIREGLPVE